MQKPNLQPRATNEALVYEQWLENQLREGSGIAPFNSGTPVKIVAEGDSWFNYIIGKDVVWWLRNRYKYDVIEVAYPGATLNHMAYGPDTKQIGDFDSSNPSQLAETIYAIKRHRPQLILLSGGGNDIAGPEFIQILKHVDSPAPGINPKVLEGLLDSYEEAYNTIIQSIGHALDRNSIDAKIILHGYDYPHPNGKSVGIGPIDFIGPWFEEPFESRGYSSKMMMLRRDLLRQVIDGFNGRLHKISDESNNNVIYLNLLGTLPEQSQWANELHPTNIGFKLIAEKFHSAITHLSAQD